MAKTYTAAEVEAYKKRINKEKWDNILLERQEWYARGKRDGEDETINALRRLLRLGPIEYD